MYWLNSVATGNRVSIESYDKAIEILDVIFESYEIRPDSHIERDVATHGLPLSNVWWVFHAGVFKYMLTSCQPISDVQVVDE